MRLRNSWKSQPHTKYSAQTMFERLTTMYESNVHVYFSLFVLNDVSNSFSHTQSDMSGNTTVTTIRPVRRPATIEKLR